MSMRARIGLTSRGWAFLGIGALVVLVGIAQGYVPVVQFGALLAVLPLGSALLTRGPGGRLTLGRTLSTRELPTGDLLRVTVEARGRFPRGHCLLLEDLAPPALGGAHRFALTGMSGQGISRPHYTLRAGARGVHHLGPMRIHVVDPFGMVHRVQVEGGRDEVLVVPRVVPLDADVLGGASAGAGSGHLGAPGAAADDVIPREYHPGDEVRRIDWKASARTGGLMVRSEESPWRSCLMLVVDLRVADHHGREPDSSLDAALSMAASVGCMALDAGWDLSVRTTDDDIVFVGSPMTGVEVQRRALLRALATTPPSTSRAPSPTLRHSADVGAQGAPVVLVAGALGVATARILAGVGGHSRQRMLVSVAADQWRAATDRGRSPADHRSDPRGDDALGHFRAAGWRVSRLERDTGIAAAWSALGVRR